MIPYCIKSVFMSMKNIWYSGWTNLSYSTTTLQSRLDCGLCLSFIVVHPDEGGGLKMELAEEKAQYHQWAACITQVYAITRSTAGQRWISEAIEKFNRICLIVDLLRWDPVPLYMLPLGFPQRFVPWDIFCLLHQASRTFLQCAWPEKMRVINLYSKGDQNLSLPLLSVWQ